jgi:hypothetical protein
MKSLKILFTRRLSVFVGRAVPGVGWVILGHDVFEIIRKSLAKYNQIVRPEDRTL